jgi:hypothetical protein
MEIKLRMGLHAGPLAVHTNKNSRSAASIEPEMGHLRVVLDNQ